MFFFRGGDARPGSGLGAVAELRPSEAGPDPYVPVIFQVSASEVSFPPAASRRIDAPGCILRNAPGPLDSRFGVVAELRPSEAAPGVHFSSVSVQKFRFEPSS